MTNPVVRTTRKQKRAIRKWNRAERRRKGVIRREMDDYDRFNY